MTRAVAVVFLVVLGAACGGGPDPVDGTAPVRCELPLQPSGDFAPIETDEVEAPDHVGIRRTYRDDDGREVHVTAGIAGEFTEGSPPAGEARLPDGTTVRVFGRDADWIGIWQPEPPCTPATVAANGFDREGFVALLAGLLPTE